MTDTPHDTLFKSTFLHLPWAAEVLRTALDPAIAARMDFSSLQVIPGSFVDEAYRHSHTDLLYSVRFAGRPARIHVLFEHQSEDDLWMALRLLLYQGRIYEAYRRDHPKARRLPPVFCVVLHHGKRPWSAPTRFEDLLDLPDDLPAAREFVPRLRFALDDLTTTSDAGIHARATSAAVHLVLLAFKHARTADDLTRLVRGWLALMSAVQLETSGPRAMQLVFRYLLEVRGAAERNVLDVVATEVEKGVQANMQTIADWLEERGMTRGLQQGHQQGLQQGHQQGRQEGLQQGQRTLLLRLLHRRFGELPAAVLARIDAADEPALLRWAEQLLTADTLDAVFAA